MVFIDSTVAFWQGHQSLDIVVALRSHSGGPMNSLQLTQSEADALLTMPKRLVDDVNVRFPQPGQRERFDLVSLDGQEQFYLDVFRSRIRLTKRTHQTRAHRTVILVRMCLDGSAHRNPDGSQVGPNHLHVYREGFADKWAHEVPADDFSDISDLWQTLEDFLRYCAIATPASGEPEMAL